MLLNEMTFRKWTFHCPSSSRRSSNIAVLRDSMLWFDLSNQPFVVLLLFTIVRSQTEL